MENRVLILAPRGRDAQVACDLLQRHDFACHVCPDVDGFVAGLEAGAGAALVTEEALAAGDRLALTRWLEAQPPWSDIPIVVLANGDKTPRTALARAVLEDLGNIVLLERPLHADAMVGAVRSALKARRRQYEIRAFAETLERSVEARTRELAAARDTLEVAMGAAGMGSWDLDLVTGAIEHSSRHDEIFGYDAPPERWTSAEFIAHVEPAERAAVARASSEAVSSGLLDIECPIRAADGSARWIAVLGRVRLDEDGTPLRITGVVSDITARKEAETRLAQAQKMDAIGQLTGGVAHDFNNLLTPIVGSLDLLRRRLGEDERASRLVEGAMQAAERAATLTQRLLAFARRQALQPRAVDVGELIDGLVDLVRRSLGPTINVVLVVPRHLPAARVDPNQLELALLNLAINARDAMPGGGRLTLAASVVAVGEGHPARLAPGSYIRIVAADTGIGMDEATLARAIEPFFSTKGVGKGTGLGLSMVHGLAAQSGGTLEMSSVVGAGTQITLWLPATDEAASAASEAAGEPPAARRPAKVLLVDDEELVRSATADMLRDLGYVVVEAGSAAQAIAALRGGIGAEVLVTDYLMPGMTGAALIAELRAADAAIPTLLITGYANAGEDVPADVPRLAKPFRQVDLAARIDQLLQSPAERHQGLRAVR
ncbi:PAS domain-containing hybrid sensor histidine kinase/response regulator [Sphingomonas profundi]|uniref:PAS domain-containing hybrid sensor histidine kinase/response regulator n=1 Tax=Alterirhizorhabdus profundi TaxID=2681549 RepID=UPI0012E7F9E9|nr:PAS domain-containing hybrid sensor histidine kinase/response regulator [Sphingomonas profundi]